MSGPQVGDRVRVTYEAEWGGPSGFSNVPSPKGWCKIDGDHAAWVPRDAKVEVLPKPELKFLGVDITDDMVIAFVRHYRKLQQAGRL